MRLLDLIAKKRDGGVHSPEELAFIASAAASGSVPDYQLSAWLMAVTLRGMTGEETAAFTRAMSLCGRRLDLSRIRARKVDKHSTGGVGDGISLALAPLVAAAGVTVPMMSGRGLGHTGGTLDKLESLRGFAVRLPLSRVARQLGAAGVCMFGQTEELAPSDRKLYALRDATATVGSLPLIVASILSKKLAEDLDALVLDIKCGSGAIFSEPRRAEELARALIGTASRLGLRAAGLITAMDQPLGLAVGNALEMRQAISVLHGDFSPSDFVSLTLALGAEMVVLGGRARSRAQAEDLLLRLIREGKALRALKAMVAAQGGDVRAVEDPGRLRLAPKTAVVRSPRAGFLTRLDALSIGKAAVALGAGRDRAEDAIDHGAGILLHKKTGAQVAKGEAVMTLYASDPRRFPAARGLAEAALAVGPRRPRRAPLVLKRMAS